MLFRRTSDRIRESFRGNTGQFGGQLGVLLIVSGRVSEGILASLEVNSCDVWGNVDEINRI